MSSASNRGDLQQAVASAYVREMLELNPILHSPQILRRRREIWDQGSNDDSAQSESAATEKKRGTKPVSPADATQERRLRKRAWDCLETLQSDFFSLPPNKLQKHLKLISEEKFPELAERAARFNVLLPQRDTLLSVADKTGDREFSNALLQSLICPAANAGPLQEQYIQQIIDQRRVKPACKAIRTLVEQHPEIYQLERDWFDVLLDPKNQSQWRQHYSHSKSVASPLDSGGARVLIAALVLVAVLVVPLIVNQSNVNDKSRSPSFRLSTGPQTSTGRTATGRTGAKQTDPDLSLLDHATLLQSLAEQTKQSQEVPSSPTSNHFQMPSAFIPSSTPALPPGSPLVLPPMKDWSLSGTSPATKPNEAPQSPAPPQIESPATAAHGSPSTLRRGPNGWPIPNLSTLPQMFPLLSLDPAFNPGLRYSPGSDPLGEVITDTWRSPLEEMIREDEAFDKHLRSIISPDIRIQPPRLSIEPGSTRPNFAPSQRPVQRPVRRLPRSPRSSTFRDPLEPFGSLPGLPSGD